MNFDRLFTISAFEALRLARVAVRNLPHLTVEECWDVTEQSWHAAYDFRSARELHLLVPAAAPPDGTLFYRECVMSLLIKEMPTWAKLMTLGRGRFIKRLQGDEYRDIRSIFRESGLLSDPPSFEDISWWDKVTSHVRFRTTAEHIARSREAERLTLEREKFFLANEGIDRMPRWIAIDDNTVGYDVLSYRKLGESLANFLIEVKSTIASPMRFILTRNEWEVAEGAGEAYIFHIWDMTKNPPILHTRTTEEIRPHIPNDNERGRWKDAEIKL
ncbi:MULTISPECIES: DUF3883 domain-containing protein [unclassified Rhizobium]|uniref:DUF3883 domain-containing protein n=1 Tax=unclassified Rhizobium TaxID=2613769 RepID=UPI001C83C539|nr:MULTISPECIES: DUF3883 domain-containing protein [unclassified Rhizobium]MBX5248780.1 DUF3883 domain-containing protein [Rhizobium sp. NLR3b]MBX5309538.1 DUF3883 domain-containing protein [Rhizobium sp. NLR14b]